jgi:hypothetical protein
MGKKPHTGSMKKPGIWKADIKNADESKGSSKTKNQTARMDAKLKQPWSPLLTGYDTIKTITPDNSMTMSPEEVEGVIRINGIARNAVEFPASDAIRNWFYIGAISADDDAERVSDRDVHPMNAQIQARMRDLQFQEKLFIHIRNEAASGSSLLYMDMNTKGPGNILSNPIELEDIKKINFLNVIDLYAVQSAQVNNYPLSKEYRQVLSYKLKNQQVVDRSRVHHLNTKFQIGNIFGYSILEPLELALDAQRTLVWAIGEVSHSMLFKVLKTKDVDFTDVKKYRERVSLLRNTLATNDLVAIGENEDLDFRTPGDLPRVQEMSSILWETISCITRVPKSILLGKTEGKVAGAEYDHLSYYIRLVSLQENFLKEAVEWVVDALFAEAGQLNPEYKITFNPLWNVSEELDAKIRKMESEIDLNEAKTEDLKKLADENLTPEEKKEIEPGGEEDE